jgi:hypothetical protein
VKSQVERERERRQAKLEEIERAVEQGSLVIREMTEAERAKYPARPRSTKRRR